MTTPSTPKVFRYQLRRGTAAEWAERNPILRGGEQGLETDSLKVKYGDGISAWSDLPYPDANSGVPQYLIDTIASLSDAVAALQDQVNNPPL